MGLDVVEIGMGADLSLDLRHFASKAVRQSKDYAPAPDMDACIRRLEEERGKIEMFKRELPLCARLLADGEHARTYLFPFSFPTCDSFSSCFFFHFWDAFFYAAMRWRVRSDRCDEGGSGEGGGGGGRRRRGQEQVDEHGAALDGRLRPGGQGTARFGRRFDP